MHALNQGPGQIIKYCPCRFFDEAFESIVQQALDAALLQASTEVTNEKES